MADNEEQGWTLEELIAIYNRAPEFFRALDLEDVNEIYRNEKESEPSITVEQLKKIRASHADLADALANDDPSLIKSD